MGFIVAGLEMGSRFVVLLLLDVDIVAFLELQLQLHQGAGNLETRLLAKVKAELDLAD